MVLGPDGNLYVGLYNMFTGGAPLIARVDGTTGAELGTITTMGGRPGGLLFDSAGDLLVANFDARSIQRYDATSGGFMGTVASLSIRPLGMAVIPEPGTALLLASGLVALAVGQRRRPL
jgi:DNA-binding beta-propeller fold protein YncE